VRQTKTPLGGCHRALASVARYRPARVERSWQSAFRMRPRILSVMPFAAENMGQKYKPRFG
jgi:hypothetical protein